MPLRCILAGGLFKGGLKKGTHFTVIEYIQKLRIEVAKKLLEEGNNLPVNDVMYECGYNDSRAFRYVFQKNSGLSPLAYKKKFK